MEALLILAILFVKSDGTGQYPTIQAAVDAAHDGDEVHLSDIGPAGPFEGPGNCLIDLQGKAIKIKPFDDEQVTHIGTKYPTTDPAFIFDGEGRNTVLETLIFWCHSEPATLIIENSAPTIRNCVFECSGGATILIENSDPLIQNCAFDECVAPFIVVDGGNECVKIWNPEIHYTYPPDNQIIAINGGCYRVIREKPLEIEPTPLSLVPMSWGQILGIYR